MSQVAVVGWPGFRAAGRLFVLFCGVTALSVGLLHAQPGAVDPTFTTGLNGVDVISTVALQADGNTVVGCRYLGSGQPQGCVARLKTNGEFDPSFKVGLGPFGSAVSTLLVQADAKLVVGGDFTIYNGVACHSMIRVNTDGSVDTSFQLPGVAGSVSLLVSQPDGKILVAGAFTNVNGVTRANLARLNPDGSLDTIFVPAPSWIYGASQMLVQQDGKILVSVVGLLARLNADGSWDDTFHAALIQNDWIDAVALQPDGQILVGGTFANSNTQGVGSRILTLRLNPDGSADPNFIPALGDDSTFNWQALGLAVQNSGKIVINGTFLHLNDLPSRTLARLNADGTLDGNFDAGAGADGQVGAMVLDGTGNILLSGAFQHFNNLAAPLLVRVTGGEPAPTAPLFKSQPLTALFNEGQTVTLTALIAAFPLPSIQWQRNGTNLPGATHQVLILTNVGPSLIGTYQLLASNSLGTVVSQAVDLGPTLLVQPLSQTVKQGQNVVFSVVSTDYLPLSFQWQFQATNLLGATNTTLLLSSVEPAQAGHYTVTVSNSVGSITSTAASLIVLPPTPPEILVQPRSQTVEVGAEVTVSVVATNCLPLVYQWQFNSTNIPGATQSTLSLQSVRYVDQGAYSVLVSSPFLSVRSEPATLVIVPVHFVPGPGVVTNLDQASLQAALGTGLPVTFGVNGVIPLTNMLVIAKDATLDARGRSITLDGQNTTRHFVVTNSATLKLINLALINGKYVGRQGDPNGPGYPGWGGSIYNSSGAVILTGCRFSSNQVVGGMGGPPESVLNSIPTDGAAGYGGAVYSENGTVQATDCVFRNNSSFGGNGLMSSYGTGAAGGDAFGGAVYATNSQVTLIGVTLTNNQVASAGGGGFNPSPPGGGTSYGGALADDISTLTLSNCVFSANQSVGSGSGRRNDSGVTYAGALFHPNGTAVIEGTLFSDNAALGAPASASGFVAESSPPAYAGAVYNGGRMEIRNSCFVGNRAIARDVIFCWECNNFAGSAIGGAIASGGSLTMSNCTLTGNSAIAGVALVGVVRYNGSPEGGAVNAYGHVTNNLLVNVTFADNVAGYGAVNNSSLPVAVGAGASILGGAVLINTILSSALNQDNLIGTFVDGGHNICSDGSLQVATPTSRTNLNPLLGPLADNGGPTPTMALLPASPAIDAGDDLACPATDQRGVARPQGLACDIGAFELAPTLTIQQGQQGMIQLEYVFQAGQTNRVTGSTNLFDWVFLGAGVSDAHGVFKFQDPESTKLPRRFYQVQPQRGP